jgi:Domain of Unknown Function (DUF1206)
MCRPAACTGPELTFHRTLTWIARAGYAGRGAVFLLLGCLAGLAALGQGPQPVGTPGAVSGLRGEPAGFAIALLIAAGLFCFAAFRVIEAASDVHGYGRDLAGALRRAALAASGIFYGGVGITAASIVFGWGGARSGDQSVQDWTAWLLGIPGGRWIVGIAGLVAIGVGIGLALAGLRETFTQRLRVDAEPRPYVRALGIAGFVARSAVDALVGAFLVYAAITANPREAEGFGGALRTIQRQPYGHALLGITAVGLLAFGLFGLGEAVFADIKRRNKPRRSRK